MTETNKYFNEAYYRSLEEDGVFQHKRGLELKAENEKILQAAANDYVTEEAQRIARLPLHERIAQGHTELPSAITVKFRKWNVVL